jgi:uncharacterized protein with PIN domain
MPKAKKWLAALQLSLDEPGQDIPCPECDGGLLQVTDVPVEDLSKAERWLHCPKCRAQNAAIWVPYKPEKGSRKINPDT